MWPCNFCSWLSYENDAFFLIFVIFREIFRKFLCMSEANDLFHFEEQTERPPGFESAQFLSNLVTL